MYHGQGTVKRMTSHRLGENIYSAYIDKGLVSRLYAYKYVFICVCIQN